MKIKPILEIVRPQQWYKNLLVFLPLVFSLQLFDADKFLVVLIGFGVLCMASGGMYVVNDVLDAKKDRLHAKKSARPIPSGRISRKRGLVIAGVLLALSGISGAMLDAAFLAAVAGMVMLTGIYSAKVKDVFLLDVLFISGNFVLRAVSGTPLVDSYVSPWLIVGVFLVALLLAFGKRFSEYDFMGGGAARHRPSLRHYTYKRLRIALLGSAIALILAYALYAVTAPPLPQASDTRLLITVPIVAFILFRYVRLTMNGGYRGGEFNDFVMAEKALLSGIILYVMSVILLLYMLPDHALSFSIFSKS